MDKNKKNEDHNDDKVNIKKLILLMITVMLCVLLYRGISTYMGHSGTEEVSYDAFLKMVDQHEIEDVKINYDKVEFKKKGDDKGKLFWTGKVDDDGLVERLEKADITFKQETTSGGDMFLSVLASYLVPLLIMGVLFYFMMRALHGGGGVKIGRASCRERV